MPVYAFQLLFQVRNLVENDTPVGLYLSFAGSTHADTSSLSFEVSPQPGESGQQILVLCQFYLTFGIGSLCPFGKNIENETGAVEYFHLQFPFDILYLFRRQVVIEDDHAYFVFFDVCFYFGQFSRPDESAGVGGVEPLKEFLHGQRSGRFCQESQFVEIFVCFRFVLGVGDQSH